MCKETNLISRLRSAIAVVFTLNILQMSKLQLSRLIKTMRALIFFPEGGRPVHEAMTFNSFFIS